MFRMHDMTFHLQAILIPLGRIWCHSKQLEQVCPKLVGKLRVKVWLEARPLGRP